MVRTQHTLRQTRKGSKKMTDDERKAVIVAVCNKLGLPPDVDECLYEVDTTEEMDTTKQVDASTPKDVINIDIDDDNDNDDEDKDDINADTKDGEVLKTKTSCTLGQQGSRYVRNVRRSHYSPRIATVTTMTMTLNQAMTRVGRRRNQEGPPRVPYVTPIKIIGQATDCPPRKRQQQFWLRLVQPARSPSSWWPMAWMKSLRSKN